MVIIVSSIVTACYNKNKSNKNIPCSYSVDKSRLRLYNGFTFYHVRQIRVRCRVARIERSEYDFLSLPLL